MIKYSDPPKPGEGRQFGRNVAAKPEAATPNGATTLELAGTLTATGWVAPSSMTYERWAAEGLTLRTAHQGVLFAVGDWLNWGEHKFGEKYAQAASDTGYNEEFLRNCKWVSSRFPAPERHHGLTFSHHKAVASLPKEAAHALLTIVGETFATDPNGGMSSKETEQVARELKDTARLRGGDGGNSQGVPVDGLSEAEIVKKAKEIRAKQITEKKAERTERVQRKQKTAAPELSTAKQYAVIYADPPWRHENPPMGTTSRSAEDKYPTMPLAEICQLPVGELAHADAMLYLWVRPGMLDAGLQVIKAWGFDYKGEFVWVKDKMGMGYYFRNQHDILLVARRGEFPLPEERARRSSVLEARRGKHSQKPDELYRILDKYHPGFEKIELFQREEGSKPPKNWAVWGDMAAGRE